MVIPQPGQNSNILSQELPEELIPGSHSGIMLLIHPMQKVSGLTYSNLRLTKTVLFIKLLFACMRFYILVLLASYSLYSCVSNAAKHESIPVAPASYVDPYTL